MLYCNATIVLKTTHGSKSTHLTIFQTPLQTGSTIRITSLVSCYWTDKVTISDRKASPLKLPVLCYTLDRERQQLKLLLRGVMSQANALIKLLINPWSHNHGAPVCYYYIVFQEFGITNAHKPQMQREREREKALGKTYTRSFLRV